MRGDGKERVVIDDFESGTLESQDEAEKAANDAAANFCVPQKALADFILRHDPMYSTPNFIGFSRLMKRHPGIVAGLGADGYELALDAMRRLLDRDRKK